MWGAALSSYQCEGKNFNTDWCVWEKEKGFQNAGLCCNHYELFEQDFKLASRLNLNSLRISLEWARICPQSSQFSEQALSHYEEVINKIISFGLTPIVTLHHFTNPIWFAKNGGWLNSKNVDGFLRYLRKTVELFKNKVQYWLILNEPCVYVYNSFIRGSWPPGTKSLSCAKKVLVNMIEAYLQGYQEIKKIYGTNLSLVSFSKHMRVFSPCSNNGLDNFAAFLRHKLFNLSVVEYLFSRNSLDFLALNYYCKEYDRFKGIFGRKCSCLRHKERKNNLGWYVYPEGFYKLLLGLKRFRLPVIITENGTAEIKDSFYEQYLLAHLQSAAKAIGEGVDLRGYFWWSLLDNFEWDKGFEKRFGLIEVDYADFRRTVRPFALTYSRICKDNRLDV